MHDQHTPVTHTILLRFPPLDVLIQHTNLLLAEALREAPRLLPRWRNGFKRHQRAAQKRVAVGVCVARPHQQAADAVNARCQEGERISKAHGLGVQPLKDAAADCFCC